jgi:hypothetical protein
MAAVIVTYRSHHNKTWYGPGAQERPGRRRYINDERRKPQGPAKTAGALGYKREKSRSLVAEPPRDDNEE